MSDYVKISNFGMKQLVGIFIHIKHKEEESRAWDIWVQLYPYMTIPMFGDKPSLKFIPFTEFFDAATSREVKKIKSVEEILAHSEDIKKRHQSRCGKGGE